MDLNKYYHKKNWTYKSNIYYSRKKKKENKLGSVFGFWHFLLHLS